MWLNLSRRSSSKHFFRLDWKATATNRMHSNDLEACGKKCCYFWFQYNLYLLTRFGVVLGQRKLTQVPIGLCTKFGELHPELRIFLNFSWVIVIYHFVGCSNVYLKIIVKYEIDHHIRDPLTRDLDFPIFLLIDFKFWHVHFRLCRSGIIYRQMF